MRNGKFCEFRSLNWEFFLYVTASMAKWSERREYEME